MTPDEINMLQCLGGLALMGFVGGSLLIGAYVWLWEHTEDMYK